MWRMCFLLLLSISAEYLRAQTTVRSFTVSPTALNFTSADPDTGTAVASSTAAWRTRRGSTNRTWQLRVYSTAANVSGCGRVPLNAFRVTCTSVSVPNGGNGSCGPAAPLSLTPQVIASGREGTNTTDSTAQLQVQFLDTWRYPAALSPSCSVVISYVIEAL